MRKLCAMCHVSILDVELWFCIEWHMVFELVANKFGVSCGEAPPIPPTSACGLEYKN